MKACFGKTLHILILTILVLTSGIYLSGCGEGAGKKWTVMMYLDGDDVLIQNDLIDAFQEMTQVKVGSNQEVNIVIQFDRYPGNPAYGGWPITHRFFLTPGMEPTEENAVKDWGDGSGGREVDMSDPVTLRDFINWSTRHYPAEHYALIVADHGFGWEGLAIDNTNYQRTMSLKQLTQAIRDSQAHIDLLCLDACTMQMAEVAYELRDTGVDILVGSENVGTTWPYADILIDVTNNPHMSAEAFGKIIVDEYNIYHSGNTGITLSELDLSKIEMLVEAVKELSVTITNGSPFSLVQENANTVLEQIRNTVLYARNSSDWESAQGLSVYFPQGGGPGANMPAELQYFYKSQIVSFAGDSLWHDVLTSCFAFEPPPTIMKITLIRFEMNTFDEDKVDLYDFCNRIVNYGDQES